MFKKFLLKKQVQKIRSLVSQLIITPEFSEKISPEECSHLWLDKKVKSWLRSHGIELTNSPSFSKGGSGIAYFLPNEMVVKVTDDVVEANVAKMLINSSVENTLIDVLNTDKYYLILQHKLDTVNTPEQMKKAADLVTALIDDYELEEFPEDQSEITQMCLETLKQYNFPKEYLEKMKIIIEILNKIYKATGFFHNDAGPTNIGSKDGKTYVFDYGPNKTKEYSADKEIEKIKNKREKLGLSDHDFE